MREVVCSTYFHKPKEGKRRTMRAQGKIKKTPKKIYQKDVGQTPQVEKRTL